MPIEPETDEPAEYAAASIARMLSRVDCQSDPDGWLLIFQDLLHKAEVAGDPKLIAMLYAAAAGAPPRRRAEVAKRVRQLESRLASVWKAHVEKHRRILVIVPKQVELNAAIAAFELTEPSKRLKSHLRYRQTSVRLSTTQEDCEVIMLCLQEAGNLPAANAVRDVQDEFGRPDLAVLCGMAMGIRDRTRLGDVVVAERVIDYEPARVTAAGEMSRFRDYSVPTPLINDLREHIGNPVGFHESFTSAAARLGVGNAPKRIRDGEPPCIALRLVLAGEKLVEDDSGQERASLHDRIDALEMEGAGFAATCTHIGVPWYVVRGVADFGGDRRQKNWQRWSALGACSFTRTFLEHAFVP